MCIVSMFSDVLLVFIRHAVYMGVTTLRQMRQMSHTKIDDSFKSELLEVCVCVCVCVRVCVGLRQLAQFYFASLRSAIK